MLQRLITAELIHLEALAAGIPDSADFRREMSAFRTGLLAQAYMNRLRGEIQPPDEVMADIRKRFQGDADAQDAARAAYVAQGYPELKARSMAALRSRFDLKVYPQNVVAGGAVDTLVAEGDGIAIKLGDLHGGLDAEAASTNVALLRRRLEESVDTLLLARGAEEAGIDVSGGLERYGHDLASRLLLRDKQRAWVPDEAAKRAWFQAHPDVGEIPTRWHVGQIVLKTRAEADQVRQRIEAGESLFTLAGEMSLDPYGRQNNGDMGWLRAGQGFPQLESVLNGLNDGDISAVVETPMGFHILTVLERRPGSQKRYEDVHDRVEQAMIATRLPEFLVGLEKKYGVTLDPESGN